jgi:alkylation response protein AidB-like acyl-CoA dehydrogenase
MDFSFSEEQEAFRKTIARFVAEEVAPLVPQHERLETFPRELFPKLGEMGLLGLKCPEAYGGAGADNVYSCILAEELAKGCRGWGIGASVFAHTSLAVTPVLLFGSAAQKDAYLGPSVAGRKIGAFGLTEPGAGSDAASVRTTAEKVPGGYVLRGTKMFITNGTMADFVIVAARSGSAGLSLFIVDRGTRGFEVGRKLEKMGCHCSETAELTFDECFVPDAALLGPEGKGLTGLKDTLTVGRIVAAAGLVGLASAAMELGLKYALERVQFGKALKRFQTVDFWLADMATEIELARLLTYKAAWLADEGKPCVREASMAKLYASEMAKRVVDKSLQIHGGYGYMREYEVERLYRDVRLMEIVEGTSEVQRMIIARSLEER